MKIIAKKSLLVLALIAIFVLFEGCYTVYQQTYTPITVPEIIAMSKKGMPAKDIIAKIKASHTLYNLKASQLADLRDQGVPNQVINYMQRTYLIAVKRDAELENQNYWWPGYDGYWYGGPSFGWPDWGWGVGFGGDDFYGNLDEGDDEGGDEGRH